MKEKCPKTIAYNLYFKLIITCSTKHELLQEETKAKSKQEIQNISDVLRRKLKMVELIMKFRQTAELKIC
jgi:transcriptional regulator of heat shock response